MHQAIFVVGTYVHMFVCLLTGNRRDMYGIRQD